jgi:tetratricopeptide (TPR) repeat protein
MKVTAVIVLVFVTAIGGCSTPGRSPTQYPASVPTQGASQFDAHSKLGYALFSKGDYDGAIQEYRQAISLDPKSAQDHILLGMALRAKGDLDGTVVEYRQAISLSPDRAQDHISLGMVLQAKGDLDGAIAEFHQAIILSPKRASADDVLGALPHQALANALKARGDLREAIEEYRRAISLSPDNAASHSQLGSALEATGNIDAAIEEFRLATEINPNYAPAQANLVRLHASPNAQAQLGVMPLGETYVTRTGPPSENEQRIPLQVRAASNTNQAEASLVLAVSWSFRGQEGGTTQPSADVIDPVTGNVLAHGFSTFTGTSGIAGTASGPVALPFSAIYMKQDNPRRVYFKIEAGDLQLWWLAGAKSATFDQGNLIQLSPGWLAASRKLSPTPEHPAGGISISSRTPNGRPLVFFVEFTEVKTLVPGPTIRRMGTQ